MSFTQQAPEFDYLEWERQQEEKHELHNGRVIAMAGGTLAHNELCVALGVSLSSRFRPKGCRVFGSDQRVMVDEHNYFYPDVSVLCSSADYDPQSDLVTEPYLVVEVLFPSTAVRDLSFKFDRYRIIPSLRHVLYVWQDAAVVEHRWRDSEQGWRIQFHQGNSAVIELDDQLLPLAEIYDRIEFASPADQRESH